MTTIQDYIWPGGINTPTPRIDMWEMTPFSHTFGYWEDGTQAGPDCKPSIIVEFPILSNGNYEGNPEGNVFYEWVRKCIGDTSLFTIDNYRKEMQC